MDIYADIGSIKNVGEKRRELLNKVGIYTVRDLIEYIPRDYTDRSIITPLKDVDEGEEYTVRAKVRGDFQLLLRGKLKIIKTIISDGSAEVSVVWFNQPYLKNTLNKHKEYLFTGSFKAVNGRLTMTAPDFDEVKEDPGLNAGRIVPKYRLTKNLNQKLLRRLIYETLGEAEELIEDFIPKYIKDEYKLPGRVFALKNIHFPENAESFFAARRRLVFEELLILQLGLLALKGEIKKKESGIKFSFFETDRIVEALPFKLTKGQEEVLDEITADMESGCPMNRLIQGDVGSGKTAVAEICAYIAYINGAQTAVMAPTDVLATQHAQTFKGLFSKLGVEVVLLKGSLKAKEKREVKKRIAEGKAHIIVGTHALIQESVTFKELGLVITDEQHRFGVNQRRLLTSKGENPHTLIMSATPIPRTLGLILYGDLDISTIKTMPAGRQRVDTSFVNSSYHERIFKFILKHVKEGRQAYIVCPMIEESAAAELKSVKAFVKDLEETCLKETRRGFVHGKMKPKEKQETMDRFAAGEIDVLIATTVIEVGINVPNAAIMVIENADRFGLSQLHQLRGRVGRGSYQSYCILVSDTKGAEAKKRLKAMVKCFDGFELSEKDLNLRGPGDFFGVRQHGIAEFKLANVYKDRDILKEVQALSAEIWENDRFLERPENRSLKKRIKDVFGEAENSSPGL
ncbi:MAG: ATP-dependent DNA helicase RecG [Clostridiales bacterium]|nr:ATP-dependent DNA helicase RecG [Clostridiales bacterium]